MGGKRGKDGGDILPGPTPMSWLRQEMRKVSLPAPLPKLGEVEPFSL